jgi:NAD(P)H dehydrogenase (quinone)
MLVTVAGATGSIGWRVIGLLFDLKRDDITMIALSRRHLDNTFRRRLVQRRIQYDDEASLQAALAGVDTLVFPGSDGDPEQMLQHHRNVIAAAQWCKVRRLVYLSALDTDKASRFPYALNTDARSTQVSNSLASSSSSVAWWTPSSFWTLLLDQHYRRA